jgi:hypothetical protein
MDTYSLRTFLSLPPRAEFSGAPKPQLSVREVAEHFRARTESPTLPYSPMNYSSAGTEIAAIFAANPWHHGTPGHDFPDNYLSSSMTLGDVNCSHWDSESALSDTPCFQCIAEMQNPDCMAAGSESADVSGTLCGLPLYSASDEFEATLHASEGVQDTHKTVARDGSRRPSVTFKDTADVYPTYDKVDYHRSRFAEDYASSEDETSDGEQDNAFEAMMPARKARAKYGESPPIWPGSLPRSSRKASFDATYLLMPMVGSSSAKGEMEDEQSLF